MSIRIRAYKPSDDEFILSLASRFTDFELPEWRHPQEIDRTSLTSLKQTLEQPEPDSVILVAETENGDAAGFIHLQTQTDYFSGEKIG